MTNILEKIIPKDKKLFLGIKSGAKRRKIELFWGGFGIIKIKYRLNNSTFRYGN